MSLTGCDVGGDLRVVDRSSSANARASHAYLPCSAEGGKLQKDQFDSILPHNRADLHCKAKTENGVSTQIRLLSTTVS